MNGSGHGRLSLREEAEARAALAAANRGGHYDDDDSDSDDDDIGVNVNNVVYPHKQQQQQQQQQYNNYYPPPPPQQQYHQPQQQQHHPLAPASTISNGTSSTNGNLPTNNTAAANNANALSENARDEWRQYGTGMTQTLQDVRDQCHTQARIVSAETRLDAGGSSYTAYIVRVLVQVQAQVQAQQQQQQQQESWIERRYSDFDKLNTALKQQQQSSSTSSNNCNIINTAVFPSKHWAGRLGPWTPSKVVAPTQHTKLIEYRCQQLDIWLVHVLQAYCSKQLHPSTAQSLERFLFGSTEQMKPCQQQQQQLGTSNDTSNNPQPTQQPWWKYLNPVSFSLGSALKQAEKTLSYMTGSEAIVDDKSIPLDLLHAAQGLAFMTVAKAGCVVSGRVGTGLVLAKLQQQNNNGNNQNAPPQWSAPCALGTIGMGWGALVGGDVTHYLIVLTTQKAVHDLVNKSKSVQLGAELGVALGPVGRSAKSHVAAGDWTLHPAYSYAHSKGLFFGVSLEGSVIAVRDDVNAKFYGHKISNVSTELLSQPAPPAAEPLCRALCQALQVQLPDDAFRPYTQLFNKESHQHQHQHQQSHQQPSSISSSTPQLQQQQPYVVVDGQYTQQQQQQQGYMNNYQNPYPHSSNGYVTAAPTGTR